MIPETSLRRLLGKRTFMGGMGQLFGLSLLLLAITVSAADEHVERQTFAVPMRDGLKLGTDVFFPSTNGAYPVLLARTPYNKLISAGAGEEGARQGYVTVIQDTRGRFASQGEN